MPERDTSNTATPAPSGAPSRFPCAQCGAALEFSPGAQSLKCEHCGHENEIPKPVDIVVEQDFRAALDELASRQETQESIDVSCESCGAQVHGLEQRTSTKCPFCGSPIVATGLSRRLIKPHALLPFKIAGRQATDSFLKWLGGLWFAPGDLKKSAAVDGRLTGLYLPAWTYDADTTTQYTGQRGDAYYVTVPYTTKVNGRSVTRMRQERRIRWSSAAGTVFNRFDDLIVVASDSLPRRMVEDLEPWDLPSLVPYDDAYLSGFGAESYKTDLREGFDLAQKQMKPAIEMSIRRDIGGDEQRISSTRTRHDNIRFKHILLPLWVAAYRYRRKVYRFLVNARTGEVRGDRPYSALKITCATIAVLMVIAVVVFFVARR